MFVTICKISQSADDDMSPIPCPAVCVTVSTTF